MVLPSVVGAFVVVTEVVVVPLYTTWGLKGNLVGGVGSPCQGPPPPHRMEAVEVLDLGVLEVLLVVVPPINLGFLHSVNFWWHRL